MSASIKNNFVSLSWASDEEEESTFTLVESKQRKKSNKKQLISKKPVEVVVKASPVPQTPSINITSLMVSIEEYEMEIAIEESKLTELETEQAALALKIEECKQRISSKKKIYEEKASLFGDLSKRMSGRITQNAQVFVSSSDFPALPESKPREKVVTKQHTSVVTKEEQLKPYPFVKIGGEYQNMEYLCKGYTFMEGGVKKTCDCQELISLSGKYITKMVALYPNYVPPVRTYECKRLNDKFFDKKQ